MSQVRILLRRPFMIDSTKRFLVEFAKKFEGHSFAFERVYDLSQFCPKHLLVIDDKKTNIIFNPEYVQDIAYALTCHKIGADVLDFRSLSIPISDEALNSAYTELFAMYSQAIEEELVKRSNI